MMEKQRKAARQVFEEQVNEMANVSEECDEMEAQPIYQQEAPQMCQQNVAPVYQQNIKNQEMSLENFAQQAVYVPPVASPSPGPRAKKKVMPIFDQKTSEELQIEKGALQVRQSGWWLWRTVVVPPNAYVVQTRRGKKAPVTLGLGISFRYRPRTDSYLVVPSALQTIGIVVRGISREKQGINILAYVQWLISDFSVAYCRLDFLNEKDPMAIVNAQLREQAEAAIKDKIATMTVDEILTDKAPIIQELTQRMRAVAEGQGNELSGMGGLGLQIVTVQIKEAYVASTRLWEFLQAPFRNEREREARLSRLHVEQEIRQQELSDQEKAATSESQTKANIEKFRAEKTSESQEVVVRERLRCQKLEADEQQRQQTMEEETEMVRRLSAKKLQENALETEQGMALLRMRQEQERLLSKTKLETERSLQEKAIASQTKMQEMELEEKVRDYEYSLKLKHLENQKKLKEAEQSLALQEIEYKLKLKMLEQEQQLKAAARAFQATIAEEQERQRLAEQQKLQDVAHERARQEIANSISDHSLSRHLIEVLPAMVEAMPQIHELKTVQISSNGSGEDGFSLLATYLAKILQVGKVLGVKLPESPVVTKPSGVIPATVPCDQTKKD
jgi:hypothetical protein